MIFSSEHVEIVDKPELFVPNVQLKGLELRFHVQWKEYVAANQQQFKVA